MKKQFNGKNNRSASDGIGHEQPTMTTSATSEKSESVKEMKSTTFFGLSMPSNIARSRSTGSDAKLGGLGSGSSRGKRSEHRRRKSSSSPSGHNKPRKADRFRRRNHSRDNVDIKDIDDDAFGDNSDGSSASGDDVTMDDIEMDYNTKFSKLNLEAIAKSFKDGIETKKHTWKMRNFHNSFIGYEAVDYLLKHTTNPNAAANYSDKSIDTNSNNSAAATTSSVRDKKSAAAAAYQECRKEAVALGRILQKKYNLFKHVQGKQKVLKDTNRHFYRFVDNLPCEVRVSLTDAEKMEMFENELETKKNYEKSNKGRNTVSGMGGMSTLTFARSRVCYENSFSGKEAIDFLINKKMIQTRMEGIQLCNKWMKEINLFEHVARCEETLRDEKTVYYQFTDTRQRYIDFSDSNNVFTLMSTVRTSSRQKRASIHLRGKKETLQFFEAIRENLSDSDDDDDDNDDDDDDDEFNDDSFHTDGMDDDDEGYSFKRDIKNIAKTFNDNMPIRDHIHKLKIYTNSFLACDAVTFLITSGIAISRNDACSLARTLESECKLFHNVCGGSEHFQDKELVYRFSNEDKMNDSCLSFDGSSSFSALILPLENVKKSFENGVGVQNNILFTNDDDDVDIDSSATKKRLYANTFDGSRAVEFLLKSKVATTRQDAIALARCLVDKYNLFERVTPLPPRDETNTNPEDNDEEGYKNFTPDKTSLYRFVPVERRKVPQIEEEEEGKRKLNSLRNVDSDNSPPKESSKLQKIADLFEKGVKVKRNKYRGKLYGQTFIGSEAVTFLVNNSLAKTRSDAIELGRILMTEKKLFVPIETNNSQQQLLRKGGKSSSSPADVFRDDYCLYRFGKDAAQDDYYSSSESTRNLKASVLNDKPLSLSEIGEIFKNGVCSSAQVKNLNNNIGGPRHNNDTSHDSIHSNNSVDALRAPTTITSTRTAISSSPSNTNSSKTATVKNALDRTKSIGMKITHGVTQGGMKISHGVTQGGMKFTQGVTQGVKNPMQIPNNLANNMLNFHHNDQFTFNGRDAVDFLVGSTLAESRFHAVDLGRTLAMELDLFKPVDGTHDFKDEADLLYRFIDEADSGFKKRAMFRPIPPQRLMTICRTFEEEIKVKDNRHGSRLYRNTFSGKEAVRWLIRKKFAKSSEEAVHIGRLIAKEYNLFEHVTMTRKFEDENIFYRFTNPSERPLNLQLARKQAARNLFSNLPIDEESEEFSDRPTYLKNTIADCSTSSLDPLTSNVSNKEWLSKAIEFENSISALTALTTRTLMKSSGGVDSANEKVKAWMSSLLRVDPRYQMRFFFDQVAQEGADNVEKRGVMGKDTMRPLQWLLPNRAAVFSVWRPTSKDAIIKMMKGEAVGKGLDIKGKSAKRGKLSAFVPFLQINENKFKKHVTMLPKDGKVRIFYPKDGRRARDIAAERLEYVLDEMIKIVKEAKIVLEDGKVASEDDEKKRKKALDSMLLDMSNPTITYLDQYAPERYGLEIPIRLFWEAFFVRQDCTRKPGSEYETGRPSQPAFQNMNLATIYSKPKEEGRIPVIYQNASPDEPMNPFELLMAYEENKRVMPVVSDFDCFLIGTKRVAFKSPLPSEQLAVLKWCVSSIEEVLDEKADTEEVEGETLSRRKTQKFEWTDRWIEVLKESAHTGYSSKIPKFGYSDPKSYSIMANAVERLQVTGAVRHGAECFNYYFPQDLDEAFLIIADGLPGNVPWMYVDVAGLQQILSDKIDEGFTFPLNPKWILCDGGKWKELYDKLMASKKENIPQSMNIWFPPDSGLREQIERISKNHPNGFY